jgi:hypothetical protein
VAEQAVTRESPPNRFYLMNNCLLFAAPDPKTLFIIGVAMIALVLIRFLLRPKRAPHTYESPLKTERNPGHMLDAPADIGHWEVEMHETARNLMGELNTKIAIVEQLVRDANAAAERLEKAVERAEKSI